MHPLGGACARAGGGVAFAPKFQDERGEGKAGVQTTPCILRSKEGGQIVSQKVIYA